MCQQANANSSNPLDNTPVSLPRGVQRQTKISMHSMPIYTVSIAFSLSAIISSWHDRENADRAIGMLPIGPISIFSIIRTKLFLICIGVYKHWSGSSDE